MKKEELRMTWGELREAYAILELDGLITFNDWVEELKKEYKLIIVGI